MAINSNSPIEYFFSASFKYRLAKAKGSKSQLVCVWHSPIPRPVLLAFKVTIFY